MEQKSKDTKKFCLTRLLPVMVFILVTIWAFLGNSARLKNEELKLLYGQTSYAVNMYSSYIERKLECVEQRTDLAADLVEKGELSAQDAIQAMMDQEDIANGAVVSRQGVGTDFYGDSVDLSKKGFSGLTVKETSTYFYDSDGMIYILTPIVKDGAFEEALMIAYDASDFDELFTDFAYSGNDWLVLLNEDGRIVYTLHGNSADYLQQDSNLIDTLRNAEGQASAVINGLKRQRSGNAGVIFEDGKRQVAYHYIMDNGWSVILGVSDAYFDSELKPYRRSINTLLLSFMGCMLLYVAIFIFNNTLDKMSTKKKREGLLQLAETDQLTGLYNKVTTEKKIKEFIEENPTTQSLLFVLDIDNFKKINDTMGHAFGDEVLREIGQGLKGQFRASDIIGRAGGDEFIILLKNLKEDRYLIREAEKLDQFFKGLQVGTYTKYSVTSSIGCAIFYRDGDNFETLYKHADEALYKAKQRGKNQVAFYTAPEGFGQNV